MCEHYTFDFQPAVSFDHAKRRSGYPFLSSDTYRSICDHHIDETNLPFKPENVALGDVVYVRAYPQFLDKLVEALPKMRHKFILLTHSSDKTMPGDYSFLLDNELLVAWFVENKGNVQHKKLIAIPIGLADPYWPHGNTQIIQDALAATRNVTKKYYLYVNFETYTNHRARDEVLKHFKNQPFSYVASRKPWEEYLKELAQSKFVLSPPGNGLDCHRPWEALLMGSIPVMISTSIDSLFDDLPVVIIEDWKQATKEFLDTKYEEIRGKTYNMGKLYADYWFKKIRAAQTYIRYGIE